MPIILSPAGDGEAGKGTSFSSPFLFPFSLPAGQEAYYGLTTPGGERVLK